jgi:hypothetical protein
MHKFMIISMLLFTATLSACENPAEFRSPIGDPAASDLDDRLIGTRVMAEGSEDDVLFFTLTIRHGEDGFIELASTVVGTELHSSGDDGTSFIWLRGTAFQSIVNDKVYLNFRLRDYLLLGKRTGQDLEIETAPYLTPHLDRGFWITQFEFSGGDRLTLSVLLNKGIDLPVRRISCGGDLS